MKKIIVGFVALAFLLVGGSAYASGWNQYPGDCPAINIGNYTTGQGVNYPCWNGTNVSATAGQVINVKVFYDNTTGSNANNTTVSINKSPSGSTSSTNFSFSGNLTSSSGNLALGQVAASISTSQSLTFSQATWYKNGSSSGVSFPSGQTGAEAFNGGLNLGSIPNGDWGSMVFSFIVGSTQQSTCTITNFTGNGSQSVNIQSGAAVNLVWNTSNCTNVSVSGPSGTVSTTLNGSQTVYPTSSGTYTITASGANGSATPQTVNVTVNSVQTCVITNFTGNGTQTLNIQSGAAVNLVWSTSNCTYALVSSPTTLLSNSLNGSQTIYPTSSGTYVIEATGTSGQAPSQYVYINVGSQSVCTILNFNVNGSQNATVISGQQATLNWNTSNCTSANISGPTGNISSSLNGPMSIYPTSSGTYTITAYGTNGQATPQTVYVTVNNTQTCVITNFTANGSSYVTVSSGNAVNIVWNTTGCTSATVSGPGMNSYNQLSGSQTVYPTYSGTYTINAYGQNGSPSQTVNVNVNGNNNYCTISNFTANNQVSTTITSGSPVTIYWSTYDCTSATVSGPGMNSYNQLSGSQTVYPTYSGTYTLSAYGTNGSPSRTVYVSVNPVVQPPVYTNTCAVTSVATNVTRNSATLNSIITNPAGASYYQYGTTVSLGSQTPARTVTGLFNEIISGLTPNTYYYFRPVAQCSGGLSYGSIEVFRTLGNPVVTTTTNTVRTNVVREVVQGTTVIGTESPIMLKIENRFQAIALGDLVDYTVTYKNIGRTLLTRPVLQVIIPKGISLINASRGTYAADTNTLTVPLEDLVPGGEGVVYLQGHVDAILSNISQVVTTAILVYTNPNGAQENAIAYVLNNPREIVVNNLGAAAFGSGFWNIGLVGWLILIILILVIILLTRRYYGNKSVIRTTTPSGSSTTTTHY